VAWARKALALDSEDSAVLYNVACLYAVLHRKKEALNCLRGVVHSGWRKEWVKNDPDLISLRDNPEFQRLLGWQRRLGRSTCLVRANSEAFA
jgi:adenylate cyclase